MALNNCPECGSEIPALAVSCPACGISNPFQQLPADPDTTRAGSHPQTIQVPEGDYSELKSRPLRAAALTLIGIVVFVAGFIFIIEGFSSSGNLLVGIVGVILIFLLVAYVLGAFRSSFKASRASRSLLYGDPNDKDLVCKSCGIFPASEVERVPPVRGKRILYGIVAAICVPAGAYCFYAAFKFEANHDLHRGLAKILLFAGVMALFFFFSKSGRCPKCHDRAIVRASSMAGRNLLANRDPDRPESSEKNL